jgi:hypothetical protein
MRVVVIATKKTPSNRASRASHAREQSSGSSAMAADGAAWMDRMGGVYVMANRQARRIRTSNDARFNIRVERRSARAAGAIRGPDMASGERTKA